MAEEPSNPPGNVRNPEVADTKTSIDTLLDLLRSKGKSELNSIAVALNTDPRIIENWAKVLENGKLIRITYEVGRMYIEPLTLPPDKQADLKTRTDVTKFILEEDLAVERISLEKFSKNIEDLNVTIGNIEKLYQKKMPEVQRILADIDRAYAPIEAKKKEMETIKADSARQLDEINKRISALNAKLAPHIMPHPESDIASKLSKLNMVVSTISSAQKAMEETASTKNKFFDSLNKQVDFQVKELRKQINDSRSGMEKELNENKRQFFELVKSLKEQESATKKLVSEMANMKKEFELSRQVLETLKTGVNDRYDKISHGIENDAKFVDEKARAIVTDVEAMKRNFGDATKLDDDIKRWKGNITEISKDVAITKSEILKLTAQLNVLDANKNISVERKAGAIGEISKGHISTAEKVRGIKNLIKRTAEEIENRAEPKA